MFLGLGQGRPRVCTPAGHGQSLCSPCLWPLPFSPVAASGGPSSAALGCGLLPMLLAVALSRGPQKSSARAPSGQFLSRQVGRGAAARDVRSVRTSGPSGCAWLGEHCGLPWVWGSQVWAPVLVPEPVWGQCDQGLSGRGLERVPLEQLRLLVPG